jgi:hypothetical protein
MTRMRRAMRRMRRVRRRMRTWMRTAAGGMRGRGIRWTREEQESASRNMRMSPVSGIHSFVLWLTPTTAELS